MVKITISLPRLAEHLPCVAQITVNLTISPMWQWRKKVPKWSIFCLTVYLMKIYCLRKKATIPKWSGCWKCIKKKRGDSHFCHEVKFPDLPGADMTGYLQCVIFQISIGWTGQIIFFAEFSRLQHRFFRSEADFFLSEYWRNTGMKIAEIILA